ncbi:hypothetical protein [Neisseria sp.]|uniref:hypothetical protein n=1 Tax=Neisseria sp. TaxID=192066 RepID=UPI0026DBB700|nr:hypothetical protein [Neisseria sp.]MDO4226463.1 hypothetical protein [Neisseria sp.]
MNSINCSEIIFNKIITFKDKKNPQMLIIRNPNLYEIEKTIVDGCKITDGIRCDFMMEIRHSNYTGIREYYIELKGTDLAKALDQILETAKILTKQHDCLKKGFIICNRSPESTTENQKLIIQARKKKIDLIIKSKKLEYEI